MDDNNFEYISLKLYENNIQYGILITNTIQYINTRIDNYRIILEILNNNNYINMRNSILQYIDNVFHVRINLAKCKQISILLNNITLYCSNNNLIRNNYYDIEINIIKNRDSNIEKHIHNIIINTNNDSWKNGQWNKIKWDKLIKLNIIIIILEGIFPYFIENSNFYAFISEDNNPNLGFYLLYQFLYNEIEYNKYVYIK